MFEKWDKQLAGLKGLDIKNNSFKKTYIPISLIMFYNFRKAKILIQHI